MENILGTVVGNIISTLILAVLGIGVTTKIITSRSDNPRKKWKILMLVSIIAIGISGANTTTYIGGVSQISEFGKSLEIIFGSLFVVGLVGNWLNK